MEDGNLEQVKKLIEEMGDHYDLPTEKQVQEMRKLTGVNWEAEELQMLCCEYWSHNSLAETAYLMFHEEYPPVREEKLAFWKYGQEIAMDENVVFEKYRFGKGETNEIESFSVIEILKRVRDRFPGWVQNIKAGNEGRSYRFDCQEQEEYWTATHFWIFLYGREECMAETQVIRFLCHNMAHRQIETIVACMEDLHCPLHIRKQRLPGQCRK